MELLLLFGNVVHAFSLASSSFVEEEHQTTYFIITSFTLLLLLVLFRDLYKKETGSNSIPASMHSKIQQQKLNDRSEDSDDKAYQEINLQNQDSKTKNFQYERLHSNKIFYKGIWKFK